MNRPDWERLYRLNHHFRAVSVAVGDRHRPLGPWRAFGFIGEHQCAQGTTHGPWRPTQAAAIRAVYRRARAFARIPDSHVRAYPRGDRMNDYPHPVGDFTAIGPECIASTPEPGPGTVINWQGAHFEYRPGEVS